MFWEKKKNLVQNCCRLSAVQRKGTLISPYSENLSWMSSSCASSWIPVTKRIHPSMLLWGPGSPTSSPSTRSYSPYQRQIRDFGLWSGKFSWSSDYFKYPKTDLYSVFDTWFTDQSQLDIILKLGITSSLSSPLPPVKPLPFLLFALSFSLLTTSSST